MAVIEIVIGKSKYKIECPEDEKSKLVHLAKKVDERVKKLLPGLVNVDEKTLLVISALMIEDDLETKIQNARTVNPQEKLVEKVEIANDVEEKKPEIPEEKKLSDDDMYIAIAENIENVADYIEKLAKKIENY